MTDLLLKIYDKNKIDQLKSFCDIIYVSKYFNFIAIRIDEKDISKLDTDKNIVYYKKSRTGLFSDFDEEIGGKVNEERLQSF